ncbi:hypothetical protein B6228_01860 [Candidatus Atribacteria bacterium 4572_76]|nr:MAG: hypothetical protein B6228_01860 [Candidatus Atribacteria bacterium 4572_76]
MLYVYIIIISIIIGLLRNGKLSSLSQISLKRIELIVLACLIQAGLIFLESKKVKYKAGLDDFALVLKEGTYVTHTLITEKTLFKFLADVIPLSPPFPDPSVVSVGDFLMFYGVFSLIQNAMVKKQNSEIRNQNSEEKELNPEV